MSKNIIMLTSMAMFSFFMFASTTYAEYVRVTKNGGTNGKYSYTSLYENDWGVYIWCQDPGNSDCPSASIATGGYDSDVNNAISQISNGTLSGSYLSSGNVVTWLSDDVKGTNSRISIVPSGQTAHDEYLPMP